MVVFKFVSKLEAFFSIKGTMDRVKRFQNRRDVEGLKPLWN